MWFSSQWWFQTSPTSFPDFSVVFNHWRLNNFVSLTFIDKHLVNGMRPLTDCFQLYHAVSWYNKSFRVKKHDGARDGSFSWKDFFVDPDIWSLVRRNLSTWHFMHLETGDYNFTMVFWARYMVKKRPDVLKNCISMFKKIVISLWVLQSYSFKSSKTAAPTE